ncbi:MAG: response regulator transcription factor [Thiohalomonadales bacterium]
MPKNINVLLVEDDIDLSASISEYLALENIQCDFAYNGQSGLQLAKQNPFDVVLLDINLPQLDGLNVCEQLRLSGIDTPVLMLTARDTLDDKLAGFRAGTDDYLVKPFALDELIARIQVLSTRRSGQMQKLHIVDLEMNFLRHEVKRANKILTVTPIGWKILETLMRASPAIITRKQLQQAVWSDEPPDSNSLKVHLFKLRQQVDVPFEKKLIHTLSGKGFTLREDI